jgi:cysteinyl-tRNA synthetase
VLGLKLGQIPNSKSEVPNNIKILMDQRQKLRGEGKYEEADKIRKQIEEEGFKVKDSGIK